MLKDELKTQIRNQTSGYIVAALSLVAGLAWSDAIKALIAFFFPLDNSGLLVKFLYAIIITTVVVIISTSLLKIPDKITETKK
jgi:hypothetical protein